MGQVLHASATTTHAARAAKQRSHASMAERSERDGVNPKTVAKWRKRVTAEDAPMGRKEQRSTVLSPEEEAVSDAFYRHTLLPLDDCRYALQASLPHLTRSSLHLCFQPHGSRRFPEMAGTTPKKRFKAYPIGYFHIDTDTDTDTDFNMAQVRTAEGKLYLFVAIDRTSKRAFARVNDAAN